jgi:hypothetical protein
LKGRFEEECLGELKVNDNWRKCYNKELMQLFGDFDILLSVRMSQLYEIGHVNRMESKRCKVFNNNPQGSQLKRLPKNRY